MIEMTGSDRSVEPANSRFELLRLQTQTFCQIRDGLCTYRGKDRWHEPSFHLRIDHRVCDLVRLLRHQATPDRIALGPEVLTFVVKPVTVLINSDAQRHAVQPRHNAAVELGGAAVYRDSVALLRVAYRFSAGVQEKFQARAFVVRRPPDYKIACCFAPSLFQPFQIGLKSSRSGNQGFGAKFSGRAVEPYPAAFNFAVGDIHLCHLSIVEDANTAACGRRIVRIHQGFAPAEEECVGSTQVQRALKGRLEASAMASHPPCGFE